MARLLGLRFGASYLNLGTHTVDLCQWANRADDTMPVEFIPSETKITATYANGVELILDFLKTPFAEHPGWVEHLGACPVRFEGEGTVETGDSGDIVVSNESLKGLLQSGKKIALGSMFPPTHGISLTASSQEAQRRPPIPT